MQDQDVGMNKEHYLDMCEAMGTPPEEDEMPLDLGDFPLMVQDCFVIFHKLTDIWDNMNGRYCGKDYNIVFKLFEVYNIEDPVVAFDFLQIMEDAKISLISTKIETRKNQEKPSTKK